MKSCNEMVNSIIERRDRHVAKQKRKRTMIIRTAASMCCVCLVALFGFGMWQGGMFVATPPARLDDSINIGEKDYITPDDLHANVGNYPNHYSPDGSEKAMISSFNVTGTLSASYVTPQNGKFGFSIPLREAMNEYEDSVMYRVVVDMFSNKKQLSSDSIQIHDECTRLSNIGYVVAYETIFDGESYHYYFTLHATHDELTNFIANENYGYFMFLYDERVG
ncbi:MAG: hypothetical protein IJD98_05325 [Oscillospiraceae bacterium]|nr:hypothetical protein [Oscillospiraceae bacterium]